MNLKSYLSGLLLTFSFFTVNAQKIGVKFGPNLSTITGYSDTSMKLGFQAGIFGETELSNTVSLRPEFFLSNQGVQSNDFVKNHWHLNLPIAFRYQESKSKLSISFGAQMSTPLHASSKNKNNEEKINTTAQLHSMNILMIAGIGITISDKSDIELRYLHGLLDAFSGSFNDSNFHNQIVQISFNILLKEK